MRRDPKAIMFVDYFPIRIPRAIGDPCAFAGLQHGLKGGHQTTSRHEHMDGTVFVVEHMHVGLAV